jgi:hypothetical protein
MVKRYGAYSVNVDKNVTFNDYTEFTFRLSYNYTLLMSVYFDDVKYFANEGYIRFYRKHALIFSLDCFYFFGRNSKNLGGFVTNLVNTVKENQGGVK